MQDIPLKVLIIDPSQSEANALRHALKDIEVIFSVEYLSLLDDTSKVFEIIDKKDINTIYIDPISLGINPASDFIFQVRRRNSGIVVDQRNEIRCHQEKRISNNKNQRRAAAVQKCHSNTVQIH